MDDLGYSHVFLNQVYDGVPVFGAQLAVHAKGDTVTGANGGYLSEIAVSTKPTLTPEAAHKAALYKRGFSTPALGGSELVIFNPTMVGQTSNTNHLAYKLAISDKSGAVSESVLVDAHTGKVLLNYSNIQTLKYREVTDVSGILRCYEEVLGGIGNPSRECRDAFYFSGLAYDYYQRVFGRDSYDRRGGIMRAAIEWGENNAQWDGFRTWFDRGFVTKDVVAHEWTHAVTLYSAALNYNGESGALNESMSDIFGAMVDRDDWLHGADKPSGASRSLSDPNAYGQPGKMSDAQLYRSGDWDCGGVHVNSGIANHAAYLMSEGGPYNGRNITGIGRDRTERIFYRVLTNYLWPSAGFKDPYSALVSAAKDLYGQGWITDNVLLAVQAVEMDQPFCGIPLVGADPYEADNTKDQAKSIAVDTEVQTHTVHFVGDNDWVKFWGLQGAVYVIRTQNLGPESETFLDLYATDGATLLASDDDGGGGLASRLNWLAPATGDYYLRVRHFDSQTYGPNTSYDLSLTAAETVNPDPYEPDDVYSQASTIGVGSTQVGHNFHYDGDNDWTKFYAESGTSYVIETLNLAPESDTILWLYAPDATTELAWSDDTVGYESRIAWTAPTSDYYYARVHHFRSDAFGVGTGYELRVAVDSGAGATAQSRVARVALTSAVAQVGEEVEATVYVSQPAVSFKVDSLADPRYLRLTAAIPLASDGSELPTNLAGEAGRWTLGNEADGRTAIRYGLKGLEQTAGSYPAIRLRWLLQAAPPNGDLAIAFDLATVDQNSQASDLSAKLVVAAAAGEPKISTVHRLVFYNGSDNIIALGGQNFVSTPKVYLWTGTTDYHVSDVTLVNSNTLCGKVRAGTKPGAYKSAPRQSRRQKLRVPGQHISGSRQRARQKGVPADGDPELTRGCLTAPRSQVGLLLAVKAHAPGNGRHDRRATMSEDNVSNQVSACKVVAAISRR